MGRAISPYELIETIENYCKSTKLFTKDGFFAKLRAQDFIRDHILKCRGITDPALRHRFLKSAIKDAIQQKSIPETLARQLYNDYFKDQKDKEQNFKYDTYDKFTTHQIAKLIASTKRQPAQQQQQIPILHNQHFSSQLSDITLPRTLRPYFFNHCKLKANQAMPMDITGRILKDGWYMYVILPSNQIRFLPNQNIQREGHALSYQKYRAHSQLSGGLPVQAAGCFEVVNGKIVKLDGSSGHYRTSKMEYVEHAKNIFAESGIDMTDVQLVPAFLSKRSSTASRTYRKCCAILRGLFLPAEVAEKRPSVDDIDEHWRGWIPRQF